jgi:hypothetical protein
MAKDPSRQDRKDVLNGTLAMAFVGNEPGCTSLEVGTAGGLRAVQIPPGGAHARLGPSLLLWIQSIREKEPH